MDLRGSGLRELSEELGVTDANGLLAGEPVPARIERRAVHLRAFPEHYSRFEEMLARRGERPEFVPLVPVSARPADVEAFLAEDHPPRGGLSVADAPMRNPLTARRPFVEAGRSTTQPKAARTAARASPAAPKWTRRPIRASMCSIPGPMWSATTSVTAWSCRKRATLA